MFKTYEVEIQKIVTVIADSEINAKKLVTGSGWIAVRARRLIK